MARSIKVLLPLALVLPIGAFVIGSLVAAAGDEPPPRPPLEITDAPPATDRTDRPTPVSPRPGRADDDRDDTGPAPDQTPPGDDDGPRTGGSGEHEDRDDRDDDGGDDDDDEDGDEDD